MLKNNTCIFKRGVALIIIATSLLSLVACGKPERGICQNCNEEISSESLFCPNCGTKVNTVCQSCNKNISAESKYCIYCGSEIEQGKLDSNDETEVEETKGEDETNATGKEDIEAKPADKPEVTPEPDPKPKPAVNPEPAYDPEPTPEPEPSINPVITATASEIHLEDNSKEIDVSVYGMTEEYSVKCTIKDSSIVDCIWGEWGEDETIPLTFVPISSGNTSVDIYIEGYKNTTITIDVSVNKPNGADLSSLTINGIGQEFETANGLYLNISVINSADYTISYYDYNDSISIEVDVIATMVKMGDPPAFGGFGYIGINYELINEAGVYVETGNLWIDTNYLNRQYEQKIYFSDLKPGKYTLNFRDNYL